MVKSQKIHLNFFLHRRARWPKRLCRNAYKINSNQECPPQPLYAAEELLSEPFAVKRLYTEDL